MPYKTVSYKDQKRAFKALDKHIFSSDSYKIPSEIYNYFSKAKKRGLIFTVVLRDPKIQLI